MREDSEARGAGAGAGPRSAGPAARSSDPRPPAPRPGHVPKALSGPTAWSGRHGENGQRGGRHRLLPGMTPRGSAGSSSRSCETPRPRGTGFRCVCCRVAVGVTMASATGAEAAAGAASGRSSEAQCGARGLANRPRAPGPVPGRAREARRMGVGARAHQGGRVRVAVLTPSSGHTGRRLRRHEPGWGGVAGAWGAVLPRG